MAMRAVLLFALLSGVFNAIAKGVPERDLVGAYEQMVIFEGGVWSLNGLGTVLRGTWSLDGDLVTFETEKEQLFHVYGRKLREPEFPYRIRFGGFRDREVWVNINPKQGSKKKKSAINLYQENNTSHTTQGRSTYVQKRPITRLLLAQKEDAVPLEPEHTTYLYSDLGGYNDFLIYMPPPIMVNSQSFKARFVDDTLVAVEGGMLGEAEPIQRRPLPDKLSLETMEHLANNGLFPKRLLYVDSVIEYGKTLLSQKLYPYIDKPTVDNTQDYVKLTAEIDLERIREKKGYLISAKCDGYADEKSCHEL